MVSSKLVLISGCSKGGLGDALALELHAKGYHVIATARDLAKIKHLADKGMETLVLDVLSTTSIAECVSNVSSQHDGRLDMLINNAGSAYCMPLSDASISESRKLFDLNVFSLLEVTQAFLPLLRQSNYGGIIVNNTSILSVLTLPFMGAYCASKAASSMLTDALRLELAPLGIKVVDLRTGAVNSNFYTNANSGQRPTLPADSMYSDAREVVEKSLSGDNVKDSNMSASIWAAQVAPALLKDTPPIRIWKGSNARLVWFAKRFLPATALDGQISAGARLPEIMKILRQKRKKG